VLAPVSVRADEVSAACPDPLSDLELHDPTDAQIRALRDDVRRSCAAIVKALGDHTAQDATTKAVNDGFGTLSDRLGESSEAGDVSPVVAGLKTLSEQDDERLVQLLGVFLGFTGMLFFWRFVLR
jgi:hypothetical protein